MLEQELARFGDEPYADLVRRKARAASVASQKFVVHRGRRGARMARREE